MNPDASTIPPPPGAPRPPTPPPSWFPDPWGESPWRWWDGARWTGYVSVPLMARRSWIPPRGTREGEIRGGLIATLGVLAAILLSVVGTLLVWWLDGSVHSLLALCVGQAGLWAGLLGACLIAVRRHGDGSLRELGWLPLSWRQLGSGTVGALIARFGGGAVAFALLQLFPNDSTANDSGYTTRLHRSVLEIAVIVFILVIGAPVVEELFFRGLVQGAITNRFGARSAVFAQAVLFGIVHFQLGMTFGQAVIVVTTIGATGLVLGSLRWHYQRLGPGMIAHALFNSVAVVALLLV